MKRTTIYLAPELEMLLKSEMLRQNRPMAEIVRQAVEAYVTREPRKPPPPELEMTETLGLSRVATTDRRHFTPLAIALSLELLP